MINVSIDRNNNLSSDECKILIDNILNKEILEEIVASDKS
jgi:hypothetical protein